MLRLLNEKRQPVQMTDIYRLLADEFVLDRYERRGTRGDPKGSAWEYMVRQARNKLVDDGLVTSPGRGMWALKETAVKN